MAAEQEVSVSGNFPVMEKDAEGKDVETGQVEKREATFKWNAPENLDEAIEMWGDDIVYTLAMQKATIKVQDTARRNLGKTGSIDTGQYLNYVPEIGRRSTSKPRKPESLEKDFEKLTAEDQAALIERLRAKMAGESNGQEAEPAVAEKKGKK